jgi:hypothetical protein
MPGDNFRDFVAEQLAPALVRHAGFTGLEVQGPFGPENYVLTQFRTRQGNRHLVFVPSSDNDWALADCPLSQATEAERNAALSNPSIERWRFPDMDWLKRFAETKARSPFPAELLAEMDEARRRHVITRTAEFVPLAKHFTERNTAAPFSIRDALVVDSSSRSVPYNPGDVIACAARMLGHVAHHQEKMGGKTAELSVKLSDVMSDVAQESRLFSLRPPILDPNVREFRPAQDSVYIVDLRQSATRGALDRHYAVKAYGGFLAYEAEGVKSPRSVTFYQLDDDGTPNGKTNFRLDEFRFATASEVRQVNPYFGNLPYTLDAGLLHARGFTPPGGPRVLVEYVRIGAGRDEPQRGWLQEDGISMEPTWEDSSGNHISNAVQFLKSRGDLVPAEGQTETFSRVWCSLRPQRRGVDAHEHEFHYFHLAGFKEEDIRKVNDLMLAPDLSRDPDGTLVEVNPFALSKEELANMRVQAAELVNFQKQRDPPHTPTL